MATRKNKSRATLWAALDAANATTALSNYVTASNTLSALDTVVDTAVANVLVATDALDALELKSNIVSSKTANNTTAVVAAASMPATTKSVKVVDENGNVVGYLACYLKATLVP